MKKVFENILQTIGNTPLIKLNDIVKDIPCNVFIKLETTNPGKSTKDRMVLSMIADAERKGMLKPGYAVIESTSGNTGLGIAIVCAVKKYKCVLTIKDKTSKEKIDLLKAYGAEVIICPSNVQPDDKLSCYSVAKQLSEELPNSIYLNQYSNEANPDGYFNTLAPEIWEQTDGKITHLIAAAGTGGTLIGTSKYLKEKSNNIRIWAVEPYGSFLKTYHETGEFKENEIYPYLVEGFGQSFLPSVYRMELIDEFFRVTDKQATIRAIEFTQKEGIMVGFSTGALLEVLCNNKNRFSSTDVVVLICHDDGSKYLSKIFNSEWVSKMI